MLDELNVIVEIDEAKVGKRKYNEGRIIKDQWVFGAIERVSGKMFIVPVKDRTSTTLFDIIYRRIARGSIIHSDSWCAYNNLNINGYSHFTVNHSRNFVDPQTGVHTQNIERLWRDMRAAIPRFGIVEEHYIHYLAEFVFKRRYSFNERIEAFFNIMSKMYQLNAE